MLKRGSPHNLHNLAKGYLKRIVLISRHETWQTVLGPVHTKTIVNTNASKRKLFYAFRPSVHTKTMKTLTVNA